MNGLEGKLGRVKIGEKWRGYGRIGFEYTMGLTPLFQFTRKTMSGLQAVNATTSHRSMRLYTVCRSERISQILSHTRP